MSKCVSSGFFALLACAALPAFAQAPPVPNVTRNVTINAPGYVLEPLVVGLNFPTAIAFSGSRTWVAESGILPASPPQVREIHRNGAVTNVLSAGQLSPGSIVFPLTDITFQDGFLWIAHRQIGVNGWDVGAISRFDPDDPVGTFRTVLTNLPATGDHYAEEIVFINGRAFISIGTATNSGVVGPDNALFTRWLNERTIGFHDFPAKDIVLSGVTFTTPNPLSPTPGATATTSPFLPINQVAAPNTLVPAATPESAPSGIIAGNGTVYSFDPEELLAPVPPSTLPPPPRLRLEAWGLRNPFGMAFDPVTGRLFVTNNGSDLRSTPVAGTLTIIEARPIANDADDMFAIDIANETEEFFGWPDFFHNAANGAPLPVTNPSFCAFPAPLTAACPGFVFAEAFRATLLPMVQPAVAQFELHSSANKFDFAFDPAFNFFGDAFVAETGAFVPVSGATQFAGYKVVRLDRESGQVQNFIFPTVATQQNIFLPDGFNKPIDVKFDRGVMFIVDFGVFEPGLQLQQPGTGKVWIVGPNRAALEPFLAR